MTKSKPIVFAIACHPDDIEFRMAGTMLLLKERGCDLHYMNIANGSWGTADYRRNEIIQMRRQEAKASAEMMGAVYHESLVDDLDVNYTDKPTLLKLIAEIRYVDPDIILVPSPVDYMEDHQNACRLAVTAAFCRAMQPAPVDPPTPIKTKNVVVYHCQPVANRTPMRKIVRPERYIDITSVLEKKRELLACHKSQKEWLDVSQGYGSYLDAMCSDGAEVGKMSGRYEYAEGMRRHLHIGYAAVDIDPLSELLKDVSWLDPDYETGLN